MPKAHKCTDCEEVFSKASNLSRHYRDKHQDSRYECPVCRKASFKRRDNLLDKHIKYAHQEVYDRLRANKKQLLKPMSRGGTSRKEPKTDGPSGSQGRRSPLDPQDDALAPLSPDTVKVCDNIIAGATEGLDLFPGEAKTYSPLNMDGSKPETILEYHPTPLTASPKKRCVKPGGKRPIEIPVCTLPGNLLQDPRRFRSQLKLLDGSTEKRTCRHGVALPVMEVAVETLPEGKRENIRINCTECPIPHYLKSKFVETKDKAIQEKADTRESGCGSHQPALEERGCDPMTIAKADVGCGTYTPKMRDSSTSMVIATMDGSTEMEPGDTPGEVWLAEQLDSAGLALSDSSDCSETEEDIEADD